MNSLIPNLFAKLRSLNDGEEGQDLVEYAMLVGLIAFSCVASMQSVATGVSTIFDNISTKLLL